MSSTRSRASRRLVATGAVLGLLVSLVVGLAGPGVGPASAAIGSACTGANSQQGAFTDAGLAANCLKAYGIAKGKADGTFGEDDPLKRSQFASFATRFLTAASIAHTARTPFRDVNSSTVPDPTVLQEIEEGHAAGVVSGFSAQSAPVVNAQDCAGSPCKAGDFGPGYDMSVAQAATIVLNLMHAIHVANSSAPDATTSSDPATNYDTAVSMGILDLAAKDKAGTTYPNAKTDTTKRGLFADMLAELLQKEVDAKVIPNALVVTEAPKGTSSPTIRSVATQSFTSTNSFEYDYDSNDIFELKGTTITMSKFAGLINPDDVLNVTYEPNPVNVSTFNITTDVVHAPDAPGARTVGSPSPGQDIVVTVVLPTNNNTDAVYKLQRSNTSCADPTPFHFSDVTTAAPGDDISDGKETDKNVQPGCYVYRVEVTSNGDPGATVADGPASNQVTVPTSDNTAPTITDVHATGDTNGLADANDTHVFTFSEPMDSGLGANGSTYRVQDGDGTQGDIICGTNATCTLDNNNVDPGPPPSSFGTLTVKLTGAPAPVTGHAGSTPGLQYSLTIIQIDSSFKDQAGNTLDLNGSDVLIERQ